jgi:putative zinc finger/helix-turn-helix YgiT family protein
MKLILDCPYCESKAELKIDKQTRTFRKEEFHVFSYYYKCKKCGKEFTTTELDEVNVHQVYNQYREKYSIPFPEQLTSIREHYGLSGAKMSEILGFGTNQFRLYESGKMPEGGNSTVLSLIVNPMSFKEILIKNSSLVSSRKYDEIIQKIDKDINDNFTICLEQSLFPQNKIPNKFTGYSIPDFEKFANMVLFLISNAPFKVRLNKLLFYADFAQYKYSGRSISGCKYAAIDMGSVPDNYSLIFGLLESKGYLTTELVTIKGKEHDKFVPCKLFDKKLFDASEIEILNSVLHKFHSKTTNEIKLISHDELAWIKNEKTKSIIDYSFYAPQLIAL